MRSRLMASVDEQFPRASGCASRASSSARRSASRCSSASSARTRRRCARSRARSKRVVASSPKVRDVQLDWNDPVRTLQGRPRPGQGARARPRAGRRRARDADRDERRDAVAAARARGPGRHRRARRAVRAPRPRHAEGRQLYTRQGTVVPLSQVAQRAYELEEPVLWRRNRDMAITVRADVKDGEQGVSVDAGDPAAAEGHRGEAAVRLSHRRGRRRRGKRQGEQRAGRRSPR